VLLVLVSSLGGGWLILAYKDRWDRKKTKRGRPCLTFIDDEVEATHWRKSGQGKGNANRMRYKLEDRLPHSYHVRTLHRRLWDTLKRKHILLSVFFLTKPHLNRPMRWTRLLLTALVTLFVHAVMVDTVFAERGCATQTTSAACAGLQDLLGGASCTWSAGAGAANKCAAAAPVGSTSVLAILALVAAGIVAPVDLLLLRLFERIGSDREIRFKLYKRVKGIEETKAGTPGPDGLVPVKTARRRGAAASAAAHARAAARALCNPAGYAPGPNDELEASEDAALVRQHVTEIMEVKWRAWRKEHPLAGFGAAAYASFTASARLPEVTAGVQKVVRLARCLQREGRYLSAEQTQIRLLEEARTMRLCIDFGAKVEALYRLTRRVPERVAPPLHSRAAVAGALAVAGAGAGLALGLLARGEGWAADGSRGAALQTLWWQCSLATALLVGGALDAAAKGLVLHTLLPQRLAKRVRHLDLTASRSECANAAKELRMGDDPAAKQAAWDAAHAAELLYRKQRLMPMPGGGPQPPLPPEEEARVEKGLRDAKDPRRALLRVLGLPEQKARLIQLGAAVPYWVPPQGEEHLWAKPGETARELSRPPSPLSVSRPGSPGRATLPGSPSGSRPGTRPGSPTGRAAARPGSPGQRGAGGGQLQLVEPMDKIAKAVEEIHERKAAEEGRQRKKLAAERRGRMLRIPLPGRGNCLVIPWPLPFGGHVPLSIPEEDGGPPAIKPLKADGSRRDSAAALTTSYNFGGSEKGPHKKSAIAASALDAVEGDAEAPADGAGAVVPKEEGEGDGDEDDEDEDKVDKRRPVDAGPGGIGAEGQVSGAPKVGDLQQWVQKMVGQRLEANGYRPLGAGKLPNGKAGPPAWGGKSDGFMAIGYEEIPVRARPRLRSRGMCRDAAAILM
jgi:hypothetical protein